MAFANTRRAIELAEKDHIPQFAYGGKVKGYTVYGKISDYVLKDVDAFSEKRRGGGFFAIFFPKVYQHLKEYKPETDILGEVEGYEKTKYRAYAARGSVLIYLNNKDLLGKDVYFNLTKKTSLMRLNYDHTQTAILSWEKRKGSNEWQIIPTESITAMSKNNIPQVAKNIVEINEQGSFEYYKDPIGDVFMTSEWLSGTPVSSVNERVIVETYSNSTYEWKNTFSIDPECRINLKELIRHKTLIGKRTNKLGKYLGRIKSLLSQQMETTRLDRIATRLMEEFSSCIIENWDNFIGPTSKKGRVVLNSFLDELAYVEPKYRSNIDTLRKKIYTNHKHKTSDFERDLVVDNITLVLDGRSTEKTTRVCQDKWYYTAYMIAKVAGVEFARIKRNFDRCWNAFKINSESCFYLLLINPYLLALIGEGLRYDDCVLLSAVIQSKDNNEGILWSREDTKEMLYVLSIYRQYTKDSQYKDTLVSYYELLNKDVKTTGMQADIITKPEAEFIWSKSRDYYNLNVKTYEVPKLFDKDFTPLEKPTDNPYKNKNIKPLETVLSKLCNIGLMYPIDKKHYIPTYEALMEVSVLDWLYSKNKKESAPISFNFVEELAQVWPKPLTQNQKTVATWSGYDTALISANVFDNYNVGSDKLVDTLDFFIHTLTTILCQKVVWVGDTYLKTTSQIEYMPRLPYVEPIYFCETPQDMAAWKDFGKSDEPITYIIDDINKYSLWELYTFMSCTKPDDKIFFIGDSNKKSSTKGVSTYSTGSYVIPSIDMGMSRDVFDCTGSAKSEVPKYQQLIAYGTGFEKAKMFDKRVLKADDSVEIEELVKEIIDKSTGKIDKSEGNEKVVADSLSINDIGIITNDTTLDLDHLLTQSEMSLGYLKNNELFQLDRIMYTGITDLEYKRYSLDKIEDSILYLTTSTETKGLSRKHELQVLQITPWQNIVIDNKSFNKPKYETALVCFMHDSILDQDCIILFDIKRNKQRQITGYSAKNLEKCHTYTFNNPPVKQKKVQILVFSENHLITKEDLYTAITKAYKRVYFVGSVQGRKSVLEISREIEETKTGRTLIERICNGKKEIKN